MQGSAPSVCATLAVLFAVSWAGAYAAGGTESLEPFWLFVPVLIAATRFGIGGAFVAGVIATVLAGPLLPAQVDVAAQPAGDWTSRGAAFVGIGLLVAAGVERLKKTFAREIELSELERHLSFRKAALVQNVSHEFRTPMTVILASTAFIAGKDQDPETASMVAALERSTSKLRGLVEVLLAAVEGPDAEPLSAEPIALDALREMVAVEFASIRGIDRLIVDVPHHVPLVVSDPIVLRAVLRALLDNALKLSPPGSPVRLSVRTLPDDIEIRISDLGPGIPPGFEAEAFEPFTQEEPARSVGGLGMGLFVARNLARRLGGDVWLERRDTGTDAVVRMKRWRAPGEEGTL